MGRLSFVSRLPHFLFKNMLDSGSFDFKVIGARNGGEEDLVGMKLSRGKEW